MTTIRDFLGWVAPLPQAAKEVVSNLDITEKGGKGSGNFGHGGRPGHVGGSMPGGAHSSSNVDAATADLAKNAAGIIERMREGGFSYRPIRGFHEIGSWGYAVSLPGYEAVFKGKEISAKNIIDHWMKIRDAVMANPKLHLGGWYDIKNDVFCLDASEVIRSKKEAIRLGIDRKQAAIFDFKKGEEIRLDADEGRLADVKEVEEVAKKTKAAQNPVIRTMVDMHQATADEEWESLKALMVAANVPVTDADREYFMAELEKKNKAKGG